MAKIMSKLEQLIAELCPHGVEWKTLIDDVYGIGMNLNAEKVRFIQNIGNDNYKDYKEVLVKQGDKPPFNIIKTISGKWRYENFHSEILEFLIKNEDIFFQNFLTLINLRKDVKPFYNHFQIKREKGRIDLFITSEDNAEDQTKKRCIIIENKLNWACDQEAQLCRYYNYAIEQGYSIDRIVYISPKNNKIPTKQTYGDKEKEIRDKLKIIHGFCGHATASKDLASCLKKTIESLPSQYDTKKVDYEVFYKHYLEILQETGVGDMSVIVNKFLEEIRATADGVEKLKYIHEMINNLQKARINYWCEHLPNSNNSGNVVCYKEYPYENVTFFMDIFNDSTFGDSWIEIANRHTDGEEFEKFQKKLEQVLIEHGLIQDFHERQPNHRFYLKQTFKAITEDEAALNVAQKLDKSLSDIRFD